MDSPRMTLYTPYQPSASKTDLQARLKGLQAAQTQVWAPLAAVYQPRHKEGRHPFRIEDSVYVHRHHAQDLEPRWKGPFTVILTIPAALKVDGVAVWIHASHAKAASILKDSPTCRTEEPAPWKLHRTQNSLEIRLAKNS